MDEKTKESIELVIFHCEMFLYGYKGPPDAIFNPVANSYNQFAGLHLVSTMFLIQDVPKEPMGGFCYRTLEPLGKSDLLDAIRQLFETPVGQTTFGDFMRLSRNKLATHGDLSFSQMPEKTQSLPFDRNAFRKFQKLMGELAEEVSRLRCRLKEIVQKDSL